MGKNGYVVAYMDFKNLPPKLGIFARYNQLDKIWQQVTADVTYVHCDNQGKVIATGQATSKEFAEFVSKNDVRRIVHTTSIQAYYYNAMYISRGENLVIELHNQDVLDISLIRAGVVETNSFFDRELEKFGGNITEYLLRYATYISGYLTHLDWREFNKKINKPTCIAEDLHYLYQELPDPVQWVIQDYQPEGRNDYIDFMSRFNFGTYRKQSFDEICKMIKKLR